MDESFYKKLLDFMADGVYFVNVDRRITFWNKSAERITGYTAKEVIGKSCSDNILRHVDESGKELCKEGCPLMEAIQDERMHEARIYLHHKFGHRLPVHIRTMSMKDLSGNIIGAVEVFNTINENFNILEEIQMLRKEALTDPLTGIGNRRFAEIRLKECERDEREYGMPYGILFLDIDHFKAVNDRWGHGVGDKVLRMVANVLTGVVRKQNAPCRWGGEEFLVVCRNVSVEELRATAELIRMLVEKSWFDHDGEKIAVTVSLGGALSKPGESFEEVVNRADQELYRSKAEGRNRVSIAP
ncbi:MAG: diguanylate cyclase [Thermodesulforhabdaceae bacterium]